MLISTLKTVSLAAVVVLATAGASLAATYAYVDNDANVRKHHFAGAPVVNQIWEGQKVKVVAQWANWVKVQIPGKDGWVKKGNLDFDYWPNNWPNNGPVNGQVCFQGQYGYICLGN